MSQLKRKNCVRVTTIIMSILIMISIQIVSFSDEIIIESDNGVKVYKHIGNDEEYLISLFEQSKGEVRFSLSRIGSYVYFGELSKQGTVYSLNDPHFIFKDFTLEMEIRDNTIILNAQSEKLNINIKDLVFFKTLDYHNPFELTPQTHEKEEWFLTETFLLSFENGKKIYSEVGYGLQSYDNLSIEDKEDYDLFYKYISNPPWETQGEGCSWYCGVMDYQTNSSSFLNSNSKYNYASSNIHDYSLLTAWVEGVNGDGYGESVSISFPSGNPRVTKVIVYNGYQKSRSSYYANGRAKVLTIYINEIEYGKLYLEDTPKAQFFDLDLSSVVNSDIELCFTFRIEEVYEGTLYKDTAISEINFDGVDVH